MAQTVSEWIFQEEKKVFNLLELGEISHAQYRLAIINIENQAKAMEKEQIKEAYNMGTWNKDEKYKNSKEYYNKTYNK